MTPHFIFYMMVVIWILYLVTKSGNQLTLAQLISVALGAIMWPLTFFVAALGSYFK